MSKFKPKWTEEEREIIVAEVCGRLAKGEPLTVICSDEGMPSVVTLFEWGEKDPSIAEAFARARTAGFDAIALDALQILEGKRPLDGLAVDVQRDKARADIRMKLLAKWDPKRYGDAFQLKHADADGEKLDTAPLITELMGLLRPAKAAQEAAEG